MLNKNSMNQQQAGAYETLYEIQAILNAQDMKRVHKSFVELNPDVLNQQQQELNRQKLILGRNSSSRVPLGLDISSGILPPPISSSSLKGRLLNLNKRTIDDRERDITPLDNQSSDLFTLQTQTMFNRVNKFKSKKIVISSQNHYNDKSQERYRNNKTFLSQRASTQFQSVPTSLSYANLPFTHKNNSVAFDLNLSLADIVNQGRLSANSQSINNKRRLISIGQQNIVSSSLHSKNESFAVFNQQLQESSRATPIGIQIKDNVFITSTQQNVEQQQQPSASSSRPPRDTSRQSDLGLQTNTRKSCERRSSMIQLKLRKISITQNPNEISSILPQKINSASSQLRNPENQIAQVKKSAVISSKVSENNLSFLLPALSQKQNYNQDNPYIKLFEARCQDLGLKPNQAQQERFLKTIEQMQSHKLTLTDQGFGDKSAIEMAKIIRNKSLNKHWTQIDLSMNRFGGSNLKVIVDALKQNTRIVSLKLQNNLINGSEDFQQIQNLIKDHPSLSTIDFSNTDTNKQRNRLGNQGLQAIVDGILQSQNSLIGIISVAGNMISTHQPIQELLKYKSSQIISLDLSDNDIGTTFFENCGQNMSQLQELKLSNTKMTNKSLKDLTKQLKEQKWQLQYLDLSSNLITSEGIQKLLNTLKSNQVLKALNLAENDFSNSAYFTVFENFFSQNKNLESFNLSQTKLDNQSLAIMARGLKKNLGLKYLNLSNNYSIGDLGMFQVCQALLDNSLHQIEEIDFSKCYLKLNNDLAIENQQKSHRRNSHNSKSLNQLQNSENHAFSNNLQKQQQYNKLFQSFCQFIKNNKTVRTLNLKDNMIRDQAAQQVLDCFKSNLKAIANNSKANRIRIQFEMNPCNHNIMKEFERLNKLNMLIYKENEMPSIQNEINNLKIQHEKALEECSMIQDNQDQQYYLENQIQIYQKFQPKLQRKQTSIVETTEQLSNQIKAIKVTKTINQLQFHVEDEDLEQVKQQERLKYKVLKRERENLRQKRIDLDFEDEQIDNRTILKEKDHQKQINDYLHKLDVVKLAQQKSQEEHKQCLKTLDRKRDQHQLQKDAWLSELEQIEKEQSITVLIYENYAKEIERVKKRIAENEMKKNQENKINKEQEDKENNQITSNYQQSESIGKISIKKSKSKSRVNKSRKDKSFSIRLKPTASKNTQQHYRQATQSAQRMLSGLSNYPHKLQQQQINQNSQEKSHIQLQNQINNTLKKQHIKDLNSTNEKIANTKEKQQKLITQQQQNQQEELFESPSSKIRDLKRLKRKLQQNFQEQDMVNNMQQQRQIQIQEYQNMISSDSNNQLQSFQSLPSEISLSSRNEGRSSSRLAILNKEAMTIEDQTYLQRY
eukprot:403360768